MLNILDSLTDNTCFLKLRGFWRGNENSKWWDNLCQWKRKYFKRSCLGAELSSALFIPKIWKNLFSANCAFILKKEFTMTAKAGRCQLSLRKYIVVIGRREQRSPFKMIFLIDGVSGSDFRHQKVGCLLKVHGKAIMTITSCVNFQQH